MGEQSLLDKMWSFVCQVIADHLPERVLLNVLCILAERVDPLGTREMWKTTFEEMYETLQE